MRSKRFMSFGIYKILSDALEYVIVCFFVRRWRQVNFNPYCQTHIVFIERIHARSFRRFCLRYYLLSRGSIQILLI